MEKVTASEYAILTIGGCFSNMPISEAKLLVLNGCFYDWNLFWTGMILNISEASIIYQPTYLGGVMPHNRR